MNSPKRFISPPDPALEACVIVPAKNEAAQLQATLTALSCQVDLTGRALRPSRWEVLLLINNSDDDSFGVAGRFRQAHPWFPLHIAECSFDSAYAHIGYVRKVLMDEAAQRLRLHPKSDSLIISTDADTEVARDWVAQNLAACVRGAEAVGGRINLRHADLVTLDARARDLQQGSDRFHLLISWLEDQCDPQPHDRWPRHHQHFGASFAVKPEAYERAGGIPPRRALEDIALYEALVQHDVRVRHSPTVCVHTSGRLESRTELGLAEQLSRWTKAGDSISVPSVQFYETLFLVRKRMRITWQRIQAGEEVSRDALAALAESCGARTAEMEEALACEYFGAAFARLQVRRKLENGLLGTDTLQTLPQALSQLQARFRMTGFNRLHPHAAEVQSGIAAL